MIFFHKKGSTRFAVIQLMNPDKSPQAHVGGAELKRARAVSHAGIRHGARSKIQVFLNKAELGQAQKCR